MARSKSPTITGGRKAPRRLSAAQLRKMRQTPGYQAGYRTANAAWVQLHRDRVSDLERKYLALLEAAETELNARAPTGPEVRDAAVYGVLEPLKDDIAAVFDRAKAEARELIREAHGDIWDAANADPLTSIRRPAA